MITSTMTTSSVTTTITTTTTTTTVSDFTILLPSLPQPQSKSSPQPLPIKCSITPEYHMSYCNKSHPLPQQSKSPITFLCPFSYFHSHPSIHHQHHIIFSAPSHSPLHNHHCGKYPILSTSKYPLFLPLSYLPLIFPPTSSPLPPPTCVGRRVVVVVVGQNEFVYK